MIEVGVYGASGYMGGEGISLGDYYHDKNRHIRRFRLYGR